MVKTTNTIKLVTPASVSKDVHIVSSAMLRVPMVVWLLLHNRTRLTIDVATVVLLLALAALALV